jgi:hypothetical protein
MAQIDIFLFIRRFFSQQKWPNKKRIRRDLDFSQLSRALISNQEFVSFYQQLARKRDTPV